MTQEFIQKLMTSIKTEHLNKMGKNIGVKLKFGSLFIIYKFVFNLQNGSTKIASQLF
jgi:hypothetical protein